jgi:gamma-glutamylcyclotransferase (GGCT)/AIG2-like uncharacterized protein YtfP
VKQRLFVYGTLAPGRPNEHVLEKIEGHWEKASVNGRLYAVGWGADYGYPALVLDEKADPVDGMIFASAELGDYWSELDEFEGDGYERVVTAAILADGSLVDAFVYILNKENEQPAETD